jgi:hypothetical protein
MATKAQSRKVELFNGDWWIVIVDGFRTLVQVRLEGPGKRTPLSVNAVAPEVAPVRIYECGDAEGYEVGADAARIVWVRRVTV